MEYYLLTSTDEIDYGRVFISDTVMRKSEPAVEDGKPLKVEARDWIDAKVRFGYELTVWQSIIHERRGGGAPEKMIDLQKTMTGIFNGTFAGRSVQWPKVRA